MQFDKLYIANTRVRHKSYNFLSNISRTFFKKIKCSSRFLSKEYFGHKCTTITQLFRKQEMNINILGYYFTAS